MSTGSTGSWGSEPLRTIVVKYLGPTGTKGSRLRALAGKGKAQSLTMPYDHACRDGGEREAATALALKLGWLGEHGEHEGRYRFIGGVLPNGDSVYLLADGGALA